MKKIIVAGGGAAGFFASIACAENHPDYEITILEKSSKLLSKVKISGGGRCNVTHACFDVKELVKNYPRGEKELLGPFTRFNPMHIIEWFERRGVNLKTEPDGRMFPVSDSSQTIIDCFLHEAERLNIKIETQNGVKGLKPFNTQWQIQTTSNELLIADAVIITTGGTPQVWQMLETIGLKIVPPVASLFTFNINDKRIEGLSGLSVEKATVQIVSHPKFNAKGPLLVTHWGLSGPAILRLSAWAARELADMKYNFEIEVNWTGDNSPNEVKESLKQFKQEHPKKNVFTTPLFDIPKRLWDRLLQSAIKNQKSEMNYADLSNKQIDQIAAVLAQCRFAVTGKSTFKEEFVTAGGVALNEIDFKAMQCKKLPGLFLAGEVLDIDAITGGFNFQGAWTTGWIAGNAV